MALVEAVLVYRPHGMGFENTQTIPIGSTDDARVLRLLRDTLLKTANRDLEMWRRTDPGLYAMKAAEYARLQHVLAVILPDGDLTPDVEMMPAWGEPHG